MSEEKKGDPGELKGPAIVAAMKRHAVERSGALARIRQLTGRCYPALEAALEEMDPAALRDFVRLLGDAKQEKQKIKNQAIHQPWRLR